MIAQHCPSMSPGEVLFHIKICLGPYIGIFCGKLHSNRKLRFTSKRISRYRSGLHQDKIIVCFTVSLKAKILMYIVLFDTLGLKKKKKFLSPQQFRSLSLKTKHNLSIKANLKPLILGNHIEPEPSTKNHDCEKS